MNSCVIPSSELGEFIQLPEQRRNEVVLRLQILNAVAIAPGASVIARIRSVSIMWRARGLRGTSVRAIQRFLYAYQRDGWRGLVSGYRFGPRPEPKPWAKGAIEKQFRAVAQGGL